LALERSHVLLPGDRFNACVTCNVWLNKLILRDLAHLVRRLRDIEVDLWRCSRFNSSKQPNRFFLPGMTVMRCLFAHKWALGTETNAPSHGPYVRTVLPYRICERCGTMQRGIFTALWGGLSWETMRERTYNKLQQRRIVRQPSSRFNRLAHSLGIRRSRMGDRTASRERSELIPS